MVETFILNTDPLDSREVGTVTGTG